MNCAKKPLSISLLLSLLIIFSSLTHAQTIINAYASVTNISGTTLTVASVDETHDTFENGETIIIMQMQDDVIGSNTNTTSSTFGNLSSIGSAGLYETAIISSITEGSVTETLWEETFEDLSNGTTNDAGVTAWSRTCSCGGPDFSGVSNMYEINGSLGYASRANTSTWTSESINITGYTDVSISMNLAQSGYDNGSDNITAAYSINGGGYTTIGATQSGNFSSTAVSVSGLSGTSLVIRVTIVNNGSNDYGRFDDVLVTGTGSGMTPSSIVLTSALTNTYSTGTNAAVQIISFPNHSNYTVSTNHTSLAWDGTTGGVFAIDVEGTLTISSNINVDGYGFSGGDQYPSGTNGGCNNGTYAAAASANYGYKGEGIYKATNGNYAAARGKIINGGGGGNLFNAGGGGGGNYTYGGDGGPGFNCTPTAGGLGGIDLSSHISAERIFMGGGGGGGQWDTSTGQAGGAGGGIIIIRANTVATSSSCGGGYSITANGEDIGTAPSYDGSGGGGAGGTILFEVPNWSLDCTNDLMITAAGGAGGDVGGSGSLSEQTHGGGGGGGKGAIIFSTTTPVTNITTTNGAGTGGANSTSGATTYADDGASAPSDGSADADGIFESTGPLPVQLLYWHGKLQHNGVMLTWATMSETNNSHFNIERSDDGKTWQNLAEVPGAGSTTSTSYYSYLDKQPAQINYYRLSQSNYDGVSEFIGIVQANVNFYETNVLLYPNPTDGNIKLQLPSGIDLEKEKIALKIYNALRQLVMANYTVHENEILIDLSNNLPGVYMLLLNFNGVSQRIKVILQ